MLGFPNATITVVTEGNTITGYDPYTGEPIIEAGSTYQIEASLEEKSQPREIELPGVNQPLAYLEGRIKDNPPTQLKAGYFYPISINLQNETKSARLYVVQTPTSRLGLDATFGKAIAGWLVD